MKKLLAVICILLVSTFVLFGCSSSVPNATTVTQGIADNPVTIFGKIIDAQTRKGIPDVKVKIKVNGDWIETTTENDSSTSPDSRVGDWKISNVPAGTTLTAFIKAPVSSATATVVYANRVITAIAVNAYPGTAAGVNAKISQDLGQWALQPGVKATVRVVDNWGAAVKYSNWAALPIAILRPAGTSLLDSMATQDAMDKDKYTIVIPQTGATTITVPALDIDADGKYDYAGNAYTINNTNSGIVAGQADVTATIVVQKINNTTALAIVANNGKTAGSNSGGTALTMIGKSDPIVVVFNMPLTSGSTDAMTLSYVDNFKNLAAAAVTAEQAITAVLSNDNTVATITPSAALIEGKTYTLNGTVHTTAVFNNDDIVNSLLINNANFLVKPTSTATTLTASGAITVDNFNYWSANVSGVADVITGPSGSNPGLANGTPYMIFPEPVWGTARLISTTTSTVASGTVINNNAPVAITGQAMVWSVVSNQVEPSTAFNLTGGKRAGLMFRWNMTGAGSMFAAGTTVADSTTANPRSYRIGLDIYDADGNTLVTEADYAVQ